MIRLIESLAGNLIFWLFVAAVVAICNRVF